MHLPRRLFTLMPLTTLLPALLPDIATASAPVVLPLWPEGVPPAVRPDAPAARGALPPEQVDAAGGIRHVAVPTLTVVPPAVDRANGAAVIVCPGGGYSYLSMNREGTQYAAWLSTLGITTFLLKSRLQDWGHPAPLQDVLRALRLVRSRAAEFGVLVYPVISMAGRATHAGSRRALLGDSPSVVGGSWSGRGGSAGREAVESQAGISRPNRANGELAPKRRATSGGLGGHGQSSTASATVTGAFRFLRPAEKP